MKPMHAFFQSWLCAVAFVLPIPGTIALRNLLLVGGLVALLATRRGVPGTRRSDSLPLLPVAWAFAVLSAWLVAHSLLVATTPGIALANLRGDWLVPALTGVVACYAAARLVPQQAIGSILFALAMHVVLTIGWQSWLWLSAGASTGWPGGQVPFAERDYQSTVAGMLLALALAERLAAQNMESLSLLGRRSGWGMLGLGLLGDIVLRTRNGTLVSAALLAAAAIVLGRRRRRALLLVALGIALGVASLTADRRWAGLTDSISTGWNSPSLYWLTWDPAMSPSTSSGAPLEESAYARAAWAHQAVTAIAEHPLGSGFGRDGFGRTIEAKYGFKGMVSSHSGLLDFTLGTGIPGLVLLLVTAGLAIRGGWHQYRRHDDPAGLMFAFLVGGYLLRCVVDGHLSGWRLGLFAFICGVLIGSMKRESRQT